MKLGFHAFLQNAPEQAQPALTQGDPKPPDGFDLLSYYKELYEKEIALSDRLNNKISNTITLLGIIGSGYVLLVAEIFPIITPFNVFSWITITLCAANLAVFVVVLRRFWRAYTGFTYDHFPIEKMEETMRVAKKRNMDEESQRVIRDRLISLYLEGSINDRKTNVDKIEKQRSLSNAIGLSMVLMILTFLMWFVFLKYAVPTAPLKP